MAKLGLIEEGGDEVAHAGNASAVIFPARETETTRGSR